MGLKLPPSFFAAQKAGQNLRALKGSLQTMVSLPSVAPAAAATPAKITPVKVTPAKVTPAKVTPAKVTPAKVTPAKATSTQIVNKTEESDKTIIDNNETKEQPGKEPDKTISDNNQAKAQESENAILRPINLLRGWPSPATLPTRKLSRAVVSVLASPKVAVLAMQYGPDEGYVPLRQEIARWLYRFYAPYPPSLDDEMTTTTTTTTSTRGSPKKSKTETMITRSSPPPSTLPPPTPLGPDRDRISITGGASQSIACILQSYSDPAATRAVWMAAPCYFLACPIFEDAGLRGKMRAAPEDEDGIDVQWLTEKMREVDGRYGGRDNGGSDGGVKTTTTAATTTANSNTDSPLGFKRAMRRKIYRHIIYVVPTSGNPSGKTLPLKRREDLLRLARRHDALVICDDIYDMLQWPVGPPSSSSNALFSSDPPSSPDPPPSSPSSPSHQSSSSQPISPSKLPKLPPLPPLPLRLPRLTDIERCWGPAPTDVNRFGHAVSNGSFSKLIGPGIRTGWVDAMPAFAAGLSYTGSNRSGGAPSQFAAVAMHAMLASGETQRHIAGVVVPDLQARHAAALAIARQRLVRLGVRVPETSMRDQSIYGGYFLWLEMPEGIAASAVVRRARQCRNLTVGAGSLFEVSGDLNGPTFDRNLRICFSWEPVEDVVEGIKRLAQAVLAIQRKANARKSQSKKSEDDDDDQDEKDEEDEEDEAESEDGDAVEEINRNGNVEDVRGSY